MITFIIVLVVVYLFVGFLWGSFLNALTTPDGSTSWQAVLHGLFWPISLLRLWR